MSIRKVSVFLHATFHTQDRCHQFLKKVYYIIAIFLLYSCQDDNIEGTWVGDYSYPTNFQNGDVVLPLIKLISFKNGKAYFKGDKTTFGKETIEGEYSLVWKNLKFNQPSENYTIKTVTKDSLVLVNNSSSFVQVLRRLPDTLKNDKSINLINNVYYWKNQNFSDTINFKSDSILLRNDGYRSQPDKINWERIKFNGFDILIMDGDVPFILQKPHNETVILWTYHKKLLQHKFRKLN